MAADLESGAITSTEALERARRELKDLIDEAVASRGRLRDDVGNIGENVAEMTLREAARLARETSAEKIAEAKQREIALEEQLKEAIELRGEGSKLALEAEIRLLEQRQRINRLERAELDRRTGNKDIFLSDEKRALDEQFAAIEAVRRARQEQAEQLREVETATRDITQATNELTADEKALADAHEKAGEAADAQARAERDAARDVESAAQRIEDAERAISDAVEERARRVEDADRRVADARQALADAHESAADRIANAEERAARGVESAERRVARIRKQLAEIDAPRLTEAQRKEQRRKELQAELQEAQRDLVDARTEGEKIVADAQKQASKMIADAQTRVADAEVARARAIEDANRRVEDAQRRRADAVQALALAEERASERIAAAIKKVTKANEALAEAQGKVNATRPSGVREGGQPQAMPVPIQPVYVAPREEAGYPSGAPAAGTPLAPQTQAPPRVPTGAHAVPAQHWAAGPSPRYAPQLAGAGAGGGRIDVYLHSDGTFVLNVAKNRAGDIIGSVNGQQAVLRLVRDAFARQ